MPNARILTALAAGALAFATAPAALAKTINVGNSNGAPTMNICAATIDCTYASYEHDKPIATVKKNGTVIDWSLNAGSSGGQVELRILRKGKIVASSAVETVSSIGLNTFGAHIKVRRGDVLALGNSSSGIYMATAGADDSVRYFQIPGQPNQSSPQLRLLLSAHVKF